MSEPKITSTELVSHTLGRLMGRGNFFRTYHAVGVDEESATCFRRAVKVTKRGMSRVDHAHIANENKILGQVEHPNIARLVETHHDVEVTDTLGKYRATVEVMELADKGEIFDFLLFTGALEPKLCVHIFGQLMRAVQFCHAQGIAHRDLKPEQLLIGSDCQLKLVDFGFAIRRELDPHSLTHTRCGTEGFLAPEVTSRHGYDPLAADMWACGVLLYTFLSGFPPFTRAQMTDPFFKALVSPTRVKFWRTTTRRGAYFSESAKDLVNKLLSIDPRQRPSATEVLNHPFMRGPCYSDTLYRKVMEERYERVLQQLEPGKRDLVLADNAMFAKVEREVAERRDNRDSQPLQFEQQPLEQHDSGELAMPQGPPSRQVSTDSSIHGLDDDEDDDEARNAHNSTCEKSNDDEISRRAAELESIEVRAMVSHTLDAFLPQSVVEIVLAYERPVSVSPVNAPQVESDNLLPLGAPQSSSSDSSVGSNTSTDELAPDSSVRRTLSNTVLAMDNALSPAQKSMLIAAQPPALETKSSQQDAFDAPPQMQHIEQGQQERATTSSSASSNSGADVPALQTPKAAGGGTAAGAGDLESSGSFNLSSAQHRRRRHRSQRDLDAALDEEDEPPRHKSRTLVDGDNDHGYERRRVQPAKAEDPARSVLPAVDPSACLAPRRGGVGAHVRAAGEPSARPLHVPSPTPSHQGDHLVNNERATLQGRVLQFD